MCTQPQKRLGAGNRDTETSGTERKRHGPFISSPRNWQAEPQGMKDEGHWLVRIRWQPRPPNTLHGTITCLICADSPSGLDNERNAGGTSQYARSVGRASVCVAGRTSRERSSLKGRARGWRRSRWRRCLADRIGGGVSLEEVGIGMGPSDGEERLERFAVLCIVQDGRWCVLPVSAA